MERILTKRTKTTFISGMLFGLLCHMFFLTNVLKNYDGVIQNGFGAGVTSGRWLLEWAGSYVKMLWGDYNIPWFGSILALFTLAIAASIVVEIFDYKKKTSWILWPGIFICFPTVASTLVFSNTSLFYAVAVLMMVLACYLAEKTKHGWVMAIILSACSMGIYQAYLPMMISVFLLLTIEKLLNTEISIKDIVQTGFTYIGIILGALVTYYGLLQWRLHHTGKTLSDYQGINELGTSGISNIGSAIYAAYKAFIQTFVADYASISATPIINVMRMVICVCALIMLMFYLAWNHTLYSLIRLFLLMLAVLMIPLAFGSIHLMCPDSAIYTLMVYGQVFFYAFYFLVFEMVTNDTAKNVLVSCGALVGSIAICCTMLNYTYQINGGYATLYYANKQAENYFAQMFAQVRMTPGFTTDKKWVFVGEDIQDPMYENPWAQKEFCYGGIGDSMLNVWSRAEFIEQTLGFKVSFATQDEIDMVRGNGELEGMTRYPNDGSIKVTKDYVIICLDETE